MVERTLQDELYVRVLSVSPGLDTGFEDFRTHNHYSPARNNLLLGFLAKATSHSWTSVANIVIIISELNSTKDLHRTASNMDSKQIARQIVEKEFLRNKRKKKKKNADDSSSSDEEDNRRKRPLITPSQVKVKDVPAVDSKYRDRAQERREGTVLKEEDVFDVDSDAEESISAPRSEQENPGECSAVSRFETTEQAQEYLQNNPSCSTTLGRAIISFWQSRWQKVNPRSALSSAVYTMTTATHPPCWIIPSEKTYPLKTSKDSGPFLSDDLLQRIHRACSKTNGQATNVIAMPKEGNSKEDANDNDEDIFGDLGEYDEQEDTEQDAERTIRKGEKVVLFQEEVVTTVEPAVVVQPQSRRLEGFSPPMAEMDYAEDDSSGDEKMKQKKKKRKRQRNGSDSA